MNERRLREQSIGGVIAYKPPYSSHKLFVLLKNPRGDRNFVKGHKEGRETDHDTLKREILEETCLKSLNIVNYLGTIRYMIMKKEIHLRKEVKFYYATTDNNQVVLSDEHADYVWAHYHQAKKLLTFNHSKSILEKIMKFGLLCD